MKRIYEAEAYKPDSGSYWASTVDPEAWPSLDQDHSCDIAIIGGGFTGLNAALTLARSGRKVAVFDAMHPGWGASGRNGGFCCAGGALITPARMDKYFGDGAGADWLRAEAQAINHVSGLLADHTIDADTHSQGETCLAHSKRAWRAMQKQAAETPPNAEAQPQLLTRQDLQAQGLNGPWLGGLTSPKGFALNPMKYLSGLSQVVKSAGAELFQNAPVSQITPHASGWHLTTGAHQVQAKQVIIATNGYSSDDLPDWLGARYLPVQSHVIVTRPLTETEQQEAGWWSDQMAYDSRNLLHYFRLMPDGRFLFGMRGGLRATAKSQQALSRKIRQDFNLMFPAWRKVEISHEWSGLVCLMGDLTPFVGQVPEAPNLYATLGFHGNGVAMGSYAGHLLAQHLIDGTALPATMAAPPGKFPLGRFRRNLLAPSYWLAETFDL
ncbi:Gamma-glutamylputrescine oxidoreductase [Pelagimonas phthalicica]|uniref:Gamma-glutamylputrescine oxidoreductase n=1 Tax=Pelagimonas phthalicica TaxID=1037362 RepID=A0A238J9K8_9RHOB|nr:FAD-binding oxidoreductase [Pelagimonas phthalicica]TDS94829.1 glycine/D-amino acid oxidase-like deaminating enzyme [Pelagimonas phthalicica]SMX26642.1 Gamma-glutamylputrescine oxidoreductase [Pelagimonas phthalicica]